MTDLISRVARDLASSKHAIVLTGAGLSTESGVPDFRGPQGIWTTDKEAEAKAYQRYELFLSDPKAYWEEMCGSEGAYGAFYNRLREAEPNPGHYALAELEKMGFLKCAITQNVDGLHEKAGIIKLIHYHGSINWLRCVACGYRYRIDEVSLAQLPPRCQCGQFLKYDVVHFKEAIPPIVMQESEEEALRCDLMLMCGTSATVYPFAGLPQVARTKVSSNTKIIEVNAEPTTLTYECISDYLIQGQTGDILPAIVKELVRMS